MDFIINFFKIFASCIPYIFGGSLFFFCVYNLYHIFKKN